MQRAELRLVYPKNERSPPLMKRRFSTDKPLVFGWQKPSLVEPSLVQLYELSTSNFPCGAAQSAPLRTEAPKKGTHFSRGCQNTIYKNGLLRASGTRSFILR